MTQQSTREVVASAARVVTGQSAAISSVDTGSTLNLFVNVTAVSGTPSMIVSVEWSHDGTTWAPADTADAMTAITTAVARVKAFTVKAPIYRVVWTISGGTPSLTFAVRDYVTG